MPQPSPYFYATEKLDSARRSLMIPHPLGEEQSIASAFQACKAGLANLKQDARDGMDDSARSWMETIERLMDTTGVTASNPHEGAYHAKARMMSNEDKRELSQSVDELAHWLRSQWN